MAALALSQIATTLGNGVFTSQEVQAATVPANEDAGEVFYISYFTFLMRKFLIALKNKATMSNQF